MADNQINVTEGSGKAVATETVSGKDYQSIKQDSRWNICAISEDATYKWFFFEDSAGNWKILRKTKATKVFDYAFGIGGYESEYVDDISAPSSATFDSYGAAT